MDGPQLQSIALSPDGAPLSWRLLLPPNLRAGQKSIPVKLEAETSGETIAPEKLSRTNAYWLEPPHLLAALLLESWCDGKLASLLMLTPDRLRQLLQPLEGQPCVFSLKTPKAALSWADGKLPGVHEFLEEPKVESPKPKTVPASSPKSEIRYQKSEIDLSPLEVDGSTHFLAITLPSRESAIYSEALELVKDHGFRLEPSNRKWWLRDRHKTLQFLSEHWDRLENHYRARFTENFQQRTANIRRAEVAFDAQEQRDGYTVDLRLAAKGVPSEQLSQALAKGQAYLEKDGDEIVLVEAAKLQKFTEAGRKLSGEDHAAPTPRLRVKLSHAELAAADEALEALDLATQTPETWQRRSTALHDLSRLESIDLPDTLSAKLRPYQQLGAGWLWHLYRNQLGGILADEMGLGKTLQALCLLTAVRQNQPEGGPALVVCPAGLVENWRREAATFTPWLKTFNHHGSTRLESAEAFARYDLVITSYGTLARDATLLHQVTFSCIVGDEAQHIKNRQTQNAKALRGLQGGQRFLLTGTPVENSLDDLRALFEFILPGYLKKPPAGLGRDERDWHNARLRERAAPYILRRSKRDVAPELPEKIEQTVFCELGRAQQAFYREVEQRARREVMQLEMGNASEGRLRVAAFQELLRLRQACIDPRLIDQAHADVDSAKLEAFREILEESLDGGHRLLVFSQFTTALKLLEAELNAQEISHLYLDGSTKNRAALCQRFNEDESIPVFLISLKAGGVGLNLTGADTVVHYDPWWNPAVEAQATDRAHRIGQTRVVTSYKLICAGTVEERVLALQQSKAALLRDLFEASEAANAKIGFADLKALLDG